MYQILNPRNCMFIYIVKFLQDVIKDVELRKLLQNVQVGDVIIMKQRNLIHRRKEGNVIPEIEIEVACHMVNNANSH